MFLRLFLQQPHYDHADASSEIAKLTILHAQECRKRAAEGELSLRQIFDDVCRTSGQGAQYMAFAEIESSMYKRRRTAMPSLPSSPLTSDQAESASCFASLGQSSFYRGQVTAGNNDTALVLAADGQLELLRASRLMFIDSTFHVVPRLYYQLFTVFVSHVDYTFPVFYALMTRKMTELYTANSAPSSTRVPTKSGDPRLRRRCDSCTTRSVRQRPDGVRVLVSLLTSCHEATEEDRLVGRVPE